MFLINAHPTRGRLLEYGRLIERGVYKIITGKRGAFIGDGRLKGRGRLFEKIRYVLVQGVYKHLVHGNNERSRLIKASKTINVQTW